MTPQPSNRRPCPPATAVLPESRNGHAQALSPRLCARSQRPQPGQPSPPGAGYSPSEPRPTAYAGQRLLGKSGDLLLLLL
jgi:hypothetical protein